MNKIIYYNKQDIERRLLIWLWVIYTNFRRLLLNGLFLVNVFFLVVEIIVFFFLFLIAKFLTRNHLNFFTFNEWGQERLVCEVSLNYLQNLCVRFYLFLRNNFEENKNETRRVRPDGPDRSISMGWRKGKPISYIGLLRIKHYKKIRT